MSETGIVSSNKVPSSMTQVGIMMKYTFLDYFRSRRFFILLTITLLISGLLTFIVGYYRPGSFLASDLSFYGGWWGNSVTFVIVLSGVFFGGDAISGEFQNKTGYFGIPNPIRRSSIYIGKWLAAFIAATAILGVFTLIQTLVATLVKIEPWFILTYGAQIIGNILMVPYPPHASVASFGPPDGPTFTTYNVTIPEGLAIIGLFFIISAVLGFGLF